MYDYEKRDKKRYKIIYGSAGILISLILIAAYFISMAQNLYAGVYKNGNYSIYLSKNGEFTVKNFITLTGVYEVKDELIRFNVQSLNGKKYVKTSVGKLKGNILTGPDNLAYEKEVAK